MSVTRVLSALAVAGITTGCIEERTEVATISLDYITSAQAGELATPYLSESGQLFVRQGDALSNQGDALNTITVRDRRDNVRRIRSVINERDASPRNVSLHFQVVRATETGSIDPALERVGGALRELLRFQGYDLVAQTVVSASERRVVEQSVNVGDLALQIGVRINDVVSDGADMEVDLRRPGHGSLLTTNVVVPMGQTVVLGSAYPGVDGEALILTVRGERGSTRLRSTSRRTSDAHGRDVKVRAVDEVHVDEHLKTSIEHQEMVARELEARAHEAAAIGAAAGVGTVTGAGGTRVRSGTRSTVPPAKAAVPRPPHER